MIISVIAPALLKKSQQTKKFGKMQCSFMIKCHSKLQISGNFLNLLRGINEKPISNLYLLVKEKKQQLNTFHPRWGQRQEYSLFVIVLEVLASAIRQEKIINGTCLNRRI